MIKFTLSNDEINSNAGFSFVQRLLDSNPAMKLWDVLHPVKPNAEYSTSIVIRSQIGLMAAGECDYASIEKFRHDFLFQQLAGSAGIPSQSTLRQRLEKLSRRDWQSLADKCVASQLSGVALTTVGFHGLNLIPVDIDVSVFEDAESHKEGTGPSYHGVTGYAPIFCYAGREGYLVANELRPGSQHCENGAVEFVERCVGILVKAGRKPRELLVRVDSGHDSSDFIRKLEELGVHYLVKRNPRSENLVQLLDTVRSCEDAEHPHAGKTVFRGFRHDRKPGAYEEDEEFRGHMVVVGVERRIAPDGQRLLVPEIEVDSWWTDLPFTVRECEWLYHDHGTSEQFHSELKSDMGVELLPSGLFSVNKLVLGLASIAFNCLRLIGQKALVHEPKPKPSAERPLRHRLRLVLLDYIKVGCKVVRHAGETLLKFGRSCPNFTIMKGIYATC